MTAAPHILIFGTGQLGRRLQQTLDAAEYEVTVIGRDRCDFLTTDARQIEIMLRAVEPSFVFNAAAFTDIDRAETDPAPAERVNAIVPGWLAAATRAQGVPFVHFSTDQVFDGVRGAPYPEDAAPRPMHVYGTTKQKGEEAVRAQGGYVFRLQWVMDGISKNFITNMAPLFSQRETMKIVADQLGAPSSAMHIAQAIAQTIPKIQAGDLPADLYHLSAGGYTSWHGLACAMVEELGLSTRLIPITSAEYPLRAIRPHNTRLDCSKLAAYGITMPHWRVGLRAMLAALKDSA